MQVVIGPRFVCDRVCWPGAILPGVEWPLFPWLLDHCVLVYPFTLAASSSMAWPLDYLSAA